MSLQTKPCLKRRISAPVETIQNNKFNSILRKSSENSMIHSKTVETSNLFNEKLSPSKKCVSFADSIGENLCHVKVFTKDNHDHYGSYWAEKILSNLKWSCSKKENKSWYLGDEDLNNYDFSESESEDEYSVLENNFYNSFGNLDVIEEDDSIIDEPINSTLVNIQSDINDKSINDEVSSTIVPAFVEPKDLPDFYGRLEDIGILLESANVIENDSIICGTICVHPEVYEIHSNIIIRYSMDGWITFSDMSTNCFQSGNKFSFSIKMKNMKIGDDLEFIVIWEKNNQIIKDDNEGMKYRFICKKKSRFQPGKSLW